ncbi:MAG: hypothetical protein PV358_19895, partial [Acidimicrobiales bacterium]|nr:hypothetical protein [Acidimicrobiales bacterium]
LGWSVGFPTAGRAARPRRGAPLAGWARPFLAISAALVVVVAWATDPGSAVEVAGVACAAAVLVVHAYRPLPPEIVAVLVIVPVSVAVARDGNLDVAFFLVTLVTLYSAWTLGSTVRAVAILVAAGASPIVASLASPEGERMMWSPWCAAAILTFVLGRTLRGQGHLIAELATARGRIEELEAMLGRYANLEHRLNEVLSSNSWRLTQAAGVPLRKLRERKG